MNELESYENIMKEDILQRVWTMLERGTGNRHDAFHTPVLATVNRQGEAEARTVVFRRLLREPFTLCCHIDIRSPKADEIYHNPRVSWLFYHPAEKVQLRIRAETSLHTDDELADRQWQNSKLFSRRCYCGEAPGTAAETPSSGLPDFLINREPTEEESNLLGRKNFAVVRSVVREIDFYELRARGHQRALLMFHENGEIEMRWLTP